MVTHAEKRHPIFIVDLAHALVFVTLLISGILLIIDWLPEHPPKVRHRKP